MPAEKYKPEFVQEIIRLGAEGKSITQMAAAFQVTDMTLRRWAKDPDKQDFAEAKAIAVTLAEAYWEDIGHKGIKGMLPKFVPVAWIYMMKSRYKDNWQENQKIEIDNLAKTLSDKELDETLEKTIKALASKKSGKVPSNSGSSAQVE